MVVLKSVLLSSCWGHPIVETQTLKAEAMILDRYLLPIAEIAVCVVVPCLLTLRALLSAAEPSKDMVSAQRTLTILVFWVCYWPALFFLNLVNVNFHVMCLFAVFYSLQKKVVLMQLLSFYRSQLLPYLSEILHSFMNVRMEAEEIDQFLDSLQEKVCFDPQFVNDSLSRFIPMMKPAKSGHVRHSSVSSLETAVEFVPLEMVDDIKSTTRRRSSGSSKAGNSQVFTLGKRSSRQNLRGDTEEFLGTPVQSRSRVPSGDLVFEDVDSRRRSKFA